MHSNFRIKDLDSENKLDQRYHAVIIPVSKRMAKKKLKSDIRKRIHHYSRSMGHTNAGKIIITKIAKRFCGPTCDLTREDDL